MQVVTPVETYEVPDIKALEQAVNEADAAWAADPGSDEKYEAWTKAIKALTDALEPEVKKLELQALLADALERGEREGFDEYYEKFPPCEFDEVEPSETLTVTVVDRKATDATWGSGPTRVITRTVEISKYCPTCGGERGEAVWSTLCEDGFYYSAQMWNNPCGHTDYYANVLEEAAALLTVTADVVDPDPWIEDGEAARLDEQADALASDKEYYDDLARIDYENGGLS